MVLYTKVHCQYSFIKQITLEIASRTRVYFISLTDTIVNSHWFCSTTFVFMQPNGRSLGLLSTIALFIVPISPSLVACFLFTEILITYSTCAAKHMQEYCFHFITCGIFNLCKFIFIFIYN